MPKKDGAKPIAVDFQLKRGVWARGKVVDKSTGKGVRAQLQYFILLDNPYLKVYPSYGTLNVSMPDSTEEDGTFKLIVMPGRGILGARAGNGPYRLGTGIDEIEGLTLKNNGMELIDARPQSLIPTNYNTLVAINPNEGDDSVTCEIPLDPGRTVKGTIVGPDGEPLAGGRVEGLEDHFRSWSREPLPSAEFEVHALGSGKSRDLLFYHEGKKLSGAYVVGADEAGPITVKLAPCGTVTGRLVDAAGRPLAGTDLRCGIPYSDAKHEAGSIPATVKTGEDGRFRAEGLVPGRRYTFHLWKKRDLKETVKGIVVAVGETRDLGDVSVDTNE